MVQYGTNTYIYHAWYNMEQTHIDHAWYNMEQTHVEHAYRYAWLQIIMEA